MKNLRLNNLSAVKCGKFKSDGNNNSEDEQEKLLFFYQALKRLN